MQPREIRPRLRPSVRISEGFGRLELLRAQEVLRRHLPPPPAEVLDVSGATGVHASWLAADGYRVDVVDLAPRHVAKANADLARLGVTAELGDARHLPVRDNAYDVVLLFGPLYHLTERRWQSGSWSGWKGWPFGSRSWLTDGTTATTARPPCGQLARSSPSRLLRV